MNNSYRYFKTSPGIIRLTVLLYAEYPVSFRNTLYWFYIIYLQWIKLYSVRFSPKAHGLKKSLNHIAK